MKKRLKIVHITTHPNLAVGGIRAHLKNLLYCLSDQKTENIILTDDSNESDRKEFQDLGVAVFSRLSSPQSEPSNPLEIIQWMTKMLKQLQPDIANTHSFRGNILGRKAAFCAEVPVIISTASNTIPTLNKKHIRISQNLSKVTDCLVCVSEAVRKYTHEVEGITHVCMPIINNGVIPEKYQFNTNYVENKNKKSLNFVFVGRLDPQKVPLRLIKAFSQIIAQGYDCRLQIIGDGSLRQECENKVKKLGLSTRVEFLGNQENPWSLVSKESIFVLSSDFEGLSIAILEAMASGSLCILPNNQAEVADPESEAIFYEVGNREQLVAAMIRVIQMSFEQRIQIIKAARARVEEDFDAHKMADKYLNLYQELYQEKVLSNFTKYQTNLIY